jgi:SAM-dependent methyltransferase
VRLVACDLCGASEVAVLFAERGPRPSNEVRSFRVVECQRCGLIYLNRRPEGSDLAAYFPQDYSNDSGSTLKYRGRRTSPSRTLRGLVRRSLLEQCYLYPSPGDSSSTEAGGLLRRMQRTCLRIERLRLRVIGREAAIIPFVGQGRLLDVGCGTGKALASFRELGWDVTGVEISPQAAWLARQRVECKICIGDFEEVSLEDEGFDVIRFCHSLEHLPSPKRALEKAYRLLQPGGLLWIEVPNAASLERRIIGRHWFA